MGRNAKLKQARRDGTAASVPNPRPGGVFIPEDWAQQLDWVINQAGMSTIACAVRVLTGDCADTVEAFGSAIEDARNHPRFKAELDALAASAPGMQLACRRGCTHCCFQDVNVTILDLFLLCREIHSQGRAEEVAAACEAIEALRSKERIALVQKVSSRMDTAPCPLLDTATGSCSVYASRPSLCRGHASNSLASCKAWAKDSTQPIWQNLGLRTPHSHQLSATEQALELLGCETAWTSLNHALPTALRQPERFERWWAGEKGVWDDVLLPADQYDISPEEVKARMAEALQLQVPSALEPQLRARQARRDDLLLALGA